MWCIKYKQFLNGKQFFQFFLLSNHCIFSANKCKEYSSLQLFVSVLKSIKIIFHKNLLFQEWRYGKMHFTHLNWYPEQNTLITTAFFLYTLWVEKALYFCQHYTSHASKIAHFRHVCALDGTQVQGRKETDSDNWQLNKSKGQHLTSLTSSERLPISHKCLFKKKIFACFLSFVYISTRLLELSFSKCW